MTYTREFPFGQFGSDVPTVSSQSLPIPSLLEGSGGQIRKKRKPSHCTSPPFSHSQILWCEQHSFCHKPKTQNVQTVIKKVNYMPARLCRAVARLLILELIMAKKLSRQGLPMSWSVRAYFYVSSSVFPVPSRSTCISMNLFQSYFYSANSCTSFLLAWLTQTMFDFLLFI